MSLYMQKTIKELFQIVGQADNLRRVSGDTGAVLRVLMNNDICLIDTKSTDYNGRVCLTYSPRGKKLLFQRLFIDGETVSVSSAMRDTAAISLERRDIERINRRTSLSFSGRK